MAERYKVGEVIDKIMKLPMNQQALVSKSGRGIYNIEIISKQGEDLPFVELKINPSSREYGILHVTKETRGFFPGYRRQFVLETDVKPFVMHLTGAGNGSCVGDEEGGYLCHPRPQDVGARLLQHASDANHARDGSFKRWFDEHEEVEPEHYVRVYRAHPELFRLESNI
jgi:hypothetical protein